MKHKGCMRKPFCKLKMNRITKIMTMNLKKTTTINRTKTLM